MLDAKERESGRCLLRYQLREGVSCRQIGRAKFVLQEHSGGARELSQNAIRQVDQYINDIARKSMRGREDWGVVGDLIHDILE